ncbi:MFS transporter [Devosia sp.]|uniref:MFS transporter n=1 Tax=Devosia sp. TaxID=1871048 RepID=UPI0026206250|nr:MFS transporter [Devosia sp.]
MDTRILWFVLAGFISGTDGFVIGSLLPSISADLGITVGEAGYVPFAYAMVYAIGTPILATLFGNIERRKVLIGAELTFAIGAVLMVLAPTLPLLIAARVVVGLGVGLFAAMALTTAVAMSPPERRGRTIAVVTSGQSLAALAGVPLGAFVVSVYNWRVIFAAIAVLALIAVVGLMWNLPRGVRGEKVTLRERLSVIGLPGIPVALLSTFLFMLAQFTVIIFIAPLAQYAGGLGAQMLPLLLLANGVGAVAGTQLGGRIADRIGARRATILAAAAQLVLLAALAAAGSLPATVGAVALFVIIPAIALTGWGFYMAQSSLISSIVPRSPALALALNLTAMNLGVALAARLGGAILDQAGAFWLAVLPVAAAITALLVASFVLPERKAIA